MPERKPIPEKLLERVNSVKNKRAKFVLDTLIKKGIVSTLELQKAGYDHPPRAVRDAVELGFAIKRVQAKRPDGQAIAAYIFDERELDPAKTGRVVLAKKEREAIIVSKGSKCNVRGATHNLQLDHKVPYAVAGETMLKSADPYQVLDGSCNRKKSWACVHCQNWRDNKDTSTCRRCYWASPDEYTHVAMRPERRAEIVWGVREINQFEAINGAARTNRRSIADQIKTMVSS